MHAISTRAVPPGQRRLAPHHHVPAGCRTSLAAAEPQPTPLAEVTPLASASARSCSELEADREELPAVRIAAAARAMVLVPPRCRRRPSD